MIVKQEGFPGYLFSLEKKGGEGSGNFGHVVVDTGFGIVVVPKEYLRMPKGGFRTRGK